MKEGGDESETFGDGGKKSETETTLVVDAEQRG